MFSISDFASTDLNIGEHEFNAAVTSKAGTAKRAMQNAFPEDALPKQKKGK